MPSGGNHRRNRRSPHQLEREELGLLIKLLRVKAGLSQQVLANRVGREHSYLSRIESADQIIDVIDLVMLIRAAGGNPRKLLNHLMDELEKEET